MAFTETQLLAQIQDSGNNMQVVITRFIPGPVFTDVYVENNLDSKTKTGGWVQLDSTLTAAQAHAAIDAAMS